MKRILLPILLLAALSMSAQPSQRPQTASGARPQRTQGMPGMPGMPGMQRPVYQINPSANPDAQGFGAAASSLEIYLPKGKSTGQIVVVCPGGGYTFLSMENEGSAVAEWLNLRGIAAAVLSYRMPMGNSSVPLDDVLKAIETVRENAETLRIDPSQVGVIGFSAGGHLAAMAVTKYTSPKNRPDFGILIYPVITMGDDTHMGSKVSLLGKEPTAAQVEAFSLEKQVTDDTPVTFVSLSLDDKTVKPVNGISFYLSLCDHNIAGSELHVYPTGGHGWGFSGRLDYRDEFSLALARWISERL